MEEAKKKAKKQNKPLRVMFQDEARFGRISDPRRCWSPPNSRPIVRTQIAREYTYVYGACSPKDGRCDFLILPMMTSSCMNIFLTELSRRYKDEYILLICDGASCHQMDAPTMPDNILMETLPPYCPDLNPAEHLWDDMRETFFYNRAFQSMEAVENQLITATLFYESHPDTIQSMTAWPWIISAI